MECEFIRYCMIAGSTVDELRCGQEESHPFCLDLKISLTESILTLHDRGISDFFCDCEYGTSFWAAEAIIAARMLRPDNPPRLHAVMPHENQPHRWSESVQERFYSIHEAADSVTMLRTQYTDDCYQEADNFMLGKSVMLLTDSGDSAIAEIAKSKGKPIEVVKLSIPR